MKLCIIYLVSINLALFIAMYLDKQRAIQRKWRVPEKTFWLLAMVGGSLGGILGMNIFRHKTKHLKFKYGFPIVLIIQIIITYIFFINKSIPHI